MRILMFRSRTRPATWYSERSKPHSSKHSRCAHSSVVSPASRWPPGKQSWPGNLSLCVTARLKRRTSDSRKHCCAENLAASLYPSSDLGLRTIQTAARCVGCLRSDYVWFIFWYRKVKLHTSYLKICACGIDHFGVKSSSSSFSFVDSFVDSTDMLNFLFFFLLLSYPILCICLISRSSNLKFNFEFS